MKGFPDWSGLPERDGDPYGASNGAGGRLSLLMKRKRHRGNKWKCLFDHLSSASSIDYQSERLGCLQIDHDFEHGRLYDLAGRQAFRL
jgi:hypothetical protein